MVEEQGASDSPLNNTIVIFNVYRTGRKLEDLCKQKGLNVTALGYLPIIWWG